MDLAEVGRVLRARWILTVLLVSASLAATVFVFSHIALQYTSQAQLVVLSPTKPVVASAAKTDAPTPAVNPFLAFGGSQEIAAQVLLVRMSDDSVGRQLADDGVEGEWKFDIRGGSGPLIQVKATESTPTKAQASADRILKVATEEFARLQRDAGAPEDQQIRVSVVNTPSAAEPVYDGKIRLSVLVAALGVLAAIGIPLAVEGMARSRREASDLTEVSESTSSASSEPIEPSDATNTNRAASEGAPGTSPAMGPARPPAVARPSAGAPTAAAAWPPAAAPTAAATVAVTAAEAPVRPLTLARPMGVRRPMVWPPAPTSEPVDPDDLEPEATAEDAAEDKVADRWLATARRASVGRAAP